MNQEEIARIFDDAVARLDERPGYSYAFDFEQGSVGVEDGWFSASSGRFALRRKHPDSALQVALLRDGEQVFIRSGSTLDYYDMRKQVHHHTKFTDSTNSNRFWAGPTNGILGDQHQLTGLINTAKRCGYRLDSLLQTNTIGEVAVFQLLGTYGKCDSAINATTLQGSQFRTYVYISIATKQFTLIRTQQLDSNDRIIMDRTAHLSEYSIPTDESFVHPSVTLPRRDWELPRQAAEKDAALFGPPAERPAPLQPGDSIPVVNAITLEGEGRTLPRANVTFLVGSSTCGWCTKSINWILDFAKRSGARDPLRKVVYVSPTDSHVRSQRYFEKRIKGKFDVPKYLVAPEEAKKLGISGVPAFIKIDSAGCVRETHFGYDTVALKRILL